MWCVIEDLPSARQRVVLLGILGLSFALHLAYIDWGLPGLWHPDEIVGRSIDLLQNRTLDPDFFLYPSLHIYLTALLAVIPTLGSQVALNLLVGEAALQGVMPISDSVRADAYLAARGLTALMGTLTVLVVYLSGARMFDKRTGLWAALLLSLSMGFIGLSHFATVDIPTVFWSLLAFYAYLVVLERPRTGNYFAAGFLTGLAISSKYTSVLLSFPLAALLVMSSAQQGRRGIRLFLNRNLAILFVSMGSGFVVGTPFSVLDFPKFVGQFVSVLSVQGTYGGEGSPAYWRHLENLLDANGFFLLPVMLSGVAYCVVLFVRRRDRSLFLLLLAIVVIYWSLGRVVFSPLRYIIVIVPFLSLCGARLVADLLGTPGWPSSARRSVTLLALVLGFSYTGIYVASGLLNIRNDDRNLARDWVLENISPTDSVEMSPRYGINIPEGYSRFRLMPYYYVHEPYARVNRSPRFQKIKRLLPWADFADYGKEETAIGVEPPEVSLESLLERRPRYLILAGRCYLRFLNQAQNGPEYFPLQNHLYRSLLNQETPYRIVADFRTKPGRFEPELEFINSRVVILEYPR